MKAVAEAIAPEDCITLNAVSEEAMLAAMELTQSRYSVGHKWRPLEVLPSSTRYPQPQMPQIIGVSGLIIDSSNKDQQGKFRALLNQFGEFLPLQSRETSYELFHCTNVLETVFDVTASEPLQTKDGKVFSYGWKAFHGDLLPELSVFTLPAPQPKGPFFTMSMVSSLRRELDTSGVRFVSPWNSENGPTRWLDV